MRLSLFFVRVIGIVGSDISNAVFGTKAQQHLIHHRFFFQTVAVNFRVEIVPQGAFPPHKSLFCLLLADIEDQRGDFPEKPTGRHNQVFLERRDQVLVDARHVVKTVGVGLGTELRELVVAVFVFGQKHGRIPVIFGGAILVVATNIELGPDDGFDARLVRRSDKLKCAHHVAMVRNRQCVHPVICGRLNQLPHVTHRLQNAELAVGVQVDKWDVFGKRLRL